MWREGKLAVDLGERIGQVLRERGWRLCTVESCTGGMLAQRITASPGASDYFERGFITYSNSAKEEMVGVSSESLRLYGAVSEVVAREMAEGARRCAPVEVSVSITGIAGPTGGSEEKPVGTVYIACCTPRRTVVIRFQFDGDRATIRHRSTEAALKLLWSEL